MANTDIIMPVESMGAMPVVRTVAPADLKDVLAKGYADFRAMPTHVIFLCLIYPVVGLLIGRASFGYDVVPMLYPLAAGFTILGPLAAIGLYELSRRRELGLDTSWRHAFDVIHSPSLREIVILGLFLLLAFIAWIAAAREIYVANFGYGEPASWPAFLGDVLGTAQGFKLMVAGNLVGLLFAVATLMVSVVSFPLLLDRHVSAVAAMWTSVRVVLANPLTMALWGLIVAGGLALGFLLFFFGLAVIVPILGHSTWHLYRRAVEPDSSLRPDYRPREKGIRYGADFPASLFSSYRKDPN